LTLRFFAAVAASFSLRFLLHHFRGAVFAASLLLRRFCGAVVTVLQCLSPFIGHNLRKSFEFTPNVSGERNMNR
jgi:hypothetical protein